MKLCVIFSTAPMYREASFLAIDQEYDCEWYFGVDTSDVKGMDVSKLKVVHNYDNWGNTSKLYWRKGILKLLFSSRYDAFLILSESRCITDYFFFGLSKILKKKVYVWTHGWYGKETRIEGFLKRWQFNHVDGVFVYSNYAKDLMIKEGIPSRVLHVIHNSLHYEKQVLLRNSIENPSLYSEHFQNNYPVIVFIGRLTKVKQLNLLLQAVYKLKLDGKVFNVVFVGDGVENKNLQQLSYSLELQGQVWFYGACYDEKINAELIYNADLCVAPGNVGLTAIHSMVFGTPVISHNDFKWQMPEFEAIIDGKTGAFFTRNNIDSLADTIENWFEEHQNRREEVREACFNEIDTQWTPQFQMRVFKEYIKA